MPKQNSTWIVVADGAHARFLTTDGTASGFVEARPELTNPEPHRFSRDLKSDRPGRSFASTGSGVRHAIEPHHDHHKLEKHKLSAAVAKILGAACEKGEFDRLVLIAPRRSLGELRGLLSQRVQSRILKEIPKDLTKLEEPKLWTLVAPVVKKRPLAATPPPSALGRTSSAGRGGKGSRTFDDAGR